MAVCALILYHAGRVVLPDYATPAFSLEVKEQTHGSQARLGRSSGCCDYRGSLVGAREVRETAGSGLACLTIGTATAHGGHLLH